MLGALMHRVAIGAVGVACVEGEKICCCWGYVPDGGRLPSSWKSHRTSFNYKEQHSTAR